MDMQLKKQELEKEFELLKQESKKIVGTLNKIQDRMKMLSAQFKLIDEMIKE
jgi:hypothetical protein